MKFIRKSNMQSEKNLDRYLMKEDKEHFIINEDSISKHEKLLKNNNINLNDKEIKELFVNFYMKNKGEEPNDELTNLFLEIMSEESEGKNETD